MPLCRNKTLLNIGNGYAQMINATQTDSINERSYMRELYYGHYYGSAWHLLRMLGYHREYLKQKIKSRLELKDIEWLDFDFKGKRGRDFELTGLDFLKNGNDNENNALEAWSDFWPQQGTPHSWDAIAKLIMPDGGGEWLLVEAKAHIDELKTDCGATSEQSIDIISKALAETAEALKITDSCNWFKEYYQYANRLAVLHFLNKHNIPARLLFIYFTGDKRPDSNFSNCPEDEAGWRNSLLKQDDHLGLTNCSGELTKRIHKVFVDVNGK